MAKIGIMGGTFNPIHNAHIELAYKALLQFKLDKVLFITNGNPPHKKGGSILDCHIRHKMVKLAIADYPKFEAYDFEITKNGPSYSYETLQHLKKQDKTNELYFIIGADSLHDITTWKRPRLIMELCTFLIYGRKGYDAQADLEKIKKEYYLKAEFIDAPDIDISSSDIREKLEENEDVSEYLNDEVYDFIKRNGLYRKKKSSLKRHLRKNLRPERFFHSLNVSKMASELAETFGFSTGKAYLAGILHDCAKCIPYEIMLKMCKDLDVELDEQERASSALIHAKLGEKVAIAHYGIYDKEILEAIRYHTLGHPDMGNIAKVVYVADMLEPTRCFDGIDYLREIAKKDLNLAIYECTKKTIEFNVAKNRPVHPMAYKMLDAFAPESDKQQL